MPNYSGVWTLQEQYEAILEGNWTGIPFEAFELYAWGLGTSGQLGDSTTQSKSSPIQIGELVNWSKVSAGNLQSFAVKTDGTMWAWGNGGSGLGDDTAVDKSSPIQIGSLTNWSSVSTFNLHTMAIKTDGTLWGWGENDSSRLGDGTQVDKSSPIQIGSDEWSQVSAGSFCTHGVKTNGTLWGWGNGVGGVIGDNARIDRTNGPVQIGSETDWAQVSAGYTHVAAITTTGELYVWGNGGSGCLGINNTTDMSSPVQVGALTNWSKVSTGQSRHTVAVKTDGTLWSWGIADNGQLGHSNTIRRSSPVQIGALTNWSEAFAGSDCSAAINTSGELYVWGRSNVSGVIGDGQTVNASSPVQVGALTNWSEVSLTNSHILAIIDSSFRTGMS